MKQDPHNGMDIIDSRDIIARIEELEALSEQDKEGLDSEDAEELAALKKEALEYYGVYNHENGNKGLYDYAVKIINLLK